jgi:hypothetical protein
MSNLFEKFIKLSENHDDEISNLGKERAEIKDKK